jgi:hypothetical protein
MDICVLNFGCAADWKLSSSDPLTYEIRSCPGVQFISPILFPSIEGLMDAKPVRSGESTRGYIGNLLLLQTAGVAFKVDPEYVEQYKPKDVSRFASYLSGQAPPLIETATSLLSALRYFSKQADMSTGSDDLNFWEWLELDELPKPAQLATSKMKWSIKKSIAEVAVTRGHIEAACACDSRFRVPIYDTIFLDAIGAHAAHDYRKSILYSAIALESAAAMVLDEQYEATVKPSTGTKWRMIELPSGAGKTARKDPVWELLKKRESAKSLLHEWALYILGRSLLVDNEQLFQLAQRLRETRNKIAHQGEPPEPQAGQYLTLDQDGSSDALNCVNAVFTWLGVGSNYKLHEHGFVSLADTLEGESFGAERTGEPPNSLQEM